MFLIMPVVTLEKRDKAKCESITHSTEAVGVPVIL